MSVIASKVASELPTYVEPMLARPGRPFDSDEYLFEVKWDGTRAVCFVDRAGAVRLMNRRRRDISGRYPELCECLESLPPGTVLDGEIVVLTHEGKPDFQQLQCREQARNPIGIRRLAKTLPSTFMVFDQLYSMYEPYFNERLDVRRERAKVNVQGCESSRVVFSEGVVGRGVDYYDAAVARGLEGVVAKRLASYYYPGKRTDAWVKIKRHEDVACVVIGFVPEGDRDFSSLVIAATVAGGVLRCVGRVGSGIDGDVRAAVNSFLWAHLAPGPVVQCEYKHARWVEPTLYCTVRCMERTAQGKLRAPVFVGLYDAD